MASFCQTTQQEQSNCGCECSDVEWVLTTDKAAAALTSRAVVGGHEACNCSPLWVIRAKYECDMIPGKLAVQRQEAYVSWGEKEHKVHNIEVCCANPDDIAWIECCDGNVPPRAVKGGWTVDGEPLYVGRANHDGSLTPGKIHPSKGVLYMPYGGKEVRVNKYEVLCTVQKY